MFCDDAVLLSYMQMLQKPKGVLINFHCVNIFKEGQKTLVNNLFFPIRAKMADGYELLNYEPRETLCNAGCALGEKLKVPVHHFLKEPLIRKYGEEFWDALDAIAREYFDVKYESKVEK